MDIQAQNTDMEMSKDTAMPTEEYPQFDNNPVPPQQYQLPPPQQYQSPPPQQYQSPPPPQYQLPPPQQYQSPPPEQYQSPPPEQYQFPPVQAPPGYVVQYPVGAEAQARQCIQVIQQQPQLMVPAPPPGGKPWSYLIYSIICLTLTAVLAWPCLACTIPSIIFSCMSKEYSYRGEWKDARCYGRWAFGLNTAALVSIILFVAFIIILPVAA